ncbi:MAG: hypothetical protein BGO31_20590 [Bacteroidetes bacterium 43-16]|nr:MAG: hypothetical protein BGO31_20590 [Bacteroidetes bacterium 43-16]
MVPYILTEAVGVLFGRKLLQPAIINDIIQDQKWSSKHARLQWKLRSTKSRRFYLQMAICISKDKKERCLLPTPVSSGGRSRKLTVTNGKIENISKKGVRYGVTIRQLAEEGFLPTPVARTAKASCTKDRKKGNIEDAIFRTVVPGSYPIKINPDFIAEMMGFPVGWLYRPFKNQS